MPKAKTTRRQRRAREKRGPKTTQQVHLEFPPELLDSLLAAVRRNPDGILPRLELAEYYLRNDREKEILDAIAALEQQYPFPDSFTRGYYNRLLAFGHAHRGQFVEAEKAARRGLGEFPESLDFYFVLAYIHLSLRELNQAIADATQFLSRWQRMKSGESPPTDFSFTGRFVTQLYNMLATAYRDKGEFEAARRYYEAAIEADPANNLPYVNLANLLRHYGQMDRANEVVEQGIKRCWQVSELRLLAQSQQPRVTVSACMIVKNEEELLPGCLESIRDWVDEIVIVDTGSTDRTVEIAESFGARLFHQPWEGDFSKHRNYSMEHATGEWIFIIDADERVYSEDISLIRKVLNQADYNLISINVFNVSGEGEEQVTFLPSIRFFRRKLGLKYEGIVHNLLVPPPGEPIMRAGIRLKHYGYGLSPEKMKEKISRSKALLEKQIAEDPDSAFARFNYAQLLRGEGVEGHPENAAKILEAAGRALQLTDPNAVSERHIHVMAHHQLAWVHFVLGEYDKAEKYCREALKIKQDYLDALLLLGQIALRQERPDRATEFFNKYLEVQARYNETCETDNIIILHPRSLPAAWYGLGLAAEQKGDRPQAHHYYRKLFETQPGFADTAVRLGRLALGDGDLAEAETAFRKNLEKDKDSIASLAGLAELCLIRKEYEQAEEYCRQALAKEATDPTVLAVYSRLLLETGREKEALAALETISKRAGHSPEMLRQLAETYFIFGRYDEAASTYERLLEADPDNGFLLNDLGNCHYKSGRWDQAVRYYQRAVQTTSCPPVTNRNLGLALLQLGRLDEAVDSFQTYLERQPDEPEIWPLLGDLYARLGRFHDAISYYEKYLRQTPESVEALFSLSECYLSLGHTDSALLGYRRAVRLDSSFEPARKRLAELA
ncbi:MAG: tetratricopeptide repeat protein, partial [Candidatus Zixiibacteriota bacterium]